MRNRVTKIKGVQRKLLEFLNTKTGFFRHGNQIRFTIHLESSESALLYLLRDKPSHNISDMIKNELAGLSGSIEYDQDTNLFSFNKNRLLIDLASENRFYSSMDAEQEGLSFVESDTYPFVVVLGLSEKIDYENRTIPIQYINETTIKVGEGSEYLISHGYISKTIIELLKKLPTIVRW